MGLMSAAKKLNHKMGAFYFGDTDKVSNQTNEQKAQMQGTFNNLDNMIDNPNVVTADRGLTNAYYQNAIANPAMQNYQQSIDPSVRANFANNYWSTGRQQGQQSALMNLQKDLSSQYQDLYNADTTANQQGQENAADRTMQANSLRGQMANAKTFDVTKNGGLIGGLMGGSGTAGGIMSLFSKGGGGSK